METMTCWDCDGVGHFEVWQEHEKVHCTVCGGEGEIPLCECGKWQVWDDEDSTWGCDCDLP